MVKLVLIAIVIVKNRRLLEEIAEMGIKKVMKNVMQVMIMVKFQRLAMVKRKHIVRRTVLLEQWLVDNVEMEQ